MGEKYINEKISSKATLRNIKTSFIITLVRSAWSAS